jgi:PAS domain S-box-containing protein
MSIKPDRGVSVREKKKPGKEVIVPEGVEESFSNSQNRVQALLNALPDLIFIIDKEGIFLDYHAPDPSSLLVPPSRFLGRHFKEILPQDVAEKLEPLIRNVLESGRLHSFEYSMMFSGETHHYEARIVPYGREKVLSIVRDITDRKKMEEVLRETQEKYRQLFDYAPTGIYEIDFQQEKFVTVNDLICAYMGYSREELLSMNPMDVLTEESKKLFYERLEKISNNQPVPDLVEYKIKTKPGSEIWVQLNTRQIYEDGKLKGATVVIHDITAIKLAEAALRESEGHLRSLMENAKEFAIYRLVYDDKNPLGVSVVFVSPSMDDILGPSDRLKFGTWFENIHPDDEKRIKKAQVMAFETLNFDEDMRIFHPKKKEWRWVRVTANGISDQDGRTTYINGIIRDITEEKKAEEALKQAHDHLEQRVKQRTMQLSKSNLRLKEEIKERRQAEEALSRSEVKLRHLSNQLIDTQENERKRIARELHDELGQSLVGLKFQLSKWTKKLEENQLELKVEIEKALKAIDLMTENVRRLSRDLRPSVLEHLGLWEALQWLFDEGVQKYGLQIINNIKDPRFSFSKEQELIIFRIFQEALTNISKHAHARQVLVQVADQGKEALFSIQDDGEGFKLNEITQSASPDRGLGLTVMDERARMAGGTLSLWSEEGKGTKISFTVPVKRGRRRTIPG